MSAHLCIFDTNPTETPSNCENSDNLSTAKLKESTIHAFMH